MENLDSFLDKFSESGRRILEGALDESRRREQYHISPEHILYMLMTIETDLFDSTMHNLSFDPQDVRLAVEKRLENSHRHIGKGFRVALDTMEIFRCSLVQARSKGRRTIEASDMCFVFATDKYNLLDDILKNPEGHDSAFRRNC